MNGNLSQGTLEIDNILSYTLVINECVLERA